MFRCIFAARFCWTTLSRSISHDVHSRRAGSDTARHRLLSGGVWPLLRVGVCLGVFNASGLRLLAGTWLGAALSAPVPGARLRWGAGPAVAGEGGGVAFAWASSTAGPAAGAGQCGCRTDSGLGVVPLLGWRLSCPTVVCLTSVLQPPLVRALPPPLQSRRHTAPLLGCPALRLSLTLGLWHRGEPVPSLCPPRSVTCRGSLLVVGMEQPSARDPGSK